MKKFIALSAIIIGLAGCSSSSDDVTVPSIDGSLDALLLNGTWATGCVVDDPISFTATGTFKDGSGNSTVTTYSDTTCTKVSMEEKETFDYIIGNDVTVDGTVAGITTATQIDITDTTPGSSGETDYELFAIINLNTLYGGDSSDVNNGSLPELRPTQLDDTPFTKQQKLRFT